jgi:hypothetical protein
MEFKFVRFSISFLIFGVALANSEDWQVPTVNYKNFSDAKKYVETRNAAITRNTTLGKRMVLSDLSMEVPVGWDMEPYAPLPPTPENNVNLQFLVNAEIFIDFALDATGKRNATVYLIRDPAGGVDPVSFDAALVKAKEQASPNAQVQHWGGLEWLVRQSSLDNSTQALMGRTRQGKTLYKFVATWEGSMTDDTAKKIFHAAETIRIGVPQLNSISPIKSPAGKMENPVLQATNQIIGQMNQNAPGEIEGKQNKGRDALIVTYNQLKTHEKENFAVPKEQLEEFLQTVEDSPYTVVLPPVCYFNQNNAFFGAAPSPEIKQAVLSLKLPKKCPYKAKHFIVYALANLDKDSDLDIWVVDEKKNLVHLKDDK